MSKFIEIALKKYIKVHPAANEKEVLKYLHILGYTKDELDKIDLSGSTKLSSKF
ncbi:MAG: hypothetical protein ACKVQB_05380 [Bacteroidia bacterium]